MAEPRRLTELATDMAAVADFPPGPAVVALSGGADSAALLWLARRLERDVRAVHVHHGLAASDRLAACAERIAARLGVRLDVVEVTVPDGPSPENQARIVRYDALLGARRDDEWVLTAHTADDQAETVLAHLLRSSGIDGLGGIPARRHPVARPLLAVTGSATREAATLAGLDWMVDPVNEEPDPLRNRIRRHLIPTLEAYNRRLGESLATTARLVATDLDFLDQAGDWTVEVSDGEAAMPASVLTTAHPALAARLARRLLAAAGLHAASPEAVADVIAVAGGEARRRDPGGGLVVQRSGANVTVARPDSPEVLEPAELVAGMVRFGRWSFESFVTEVAPVMPVGAAWMVADAAVGPLRVETVGDSPPLREALADGGVPSGERSAHPVVVSDAGPVWLPMVRRLPVGWVDQATERYLVVHSRTDRKWQTFAR